MLKYKYVSHEKIHGSNFIKQHAETAMVCKISKMPAAVLKDKFIVLFVIIFGTLSFHIAQLCGDLYCKKTFEGRNCTLLFDINCIA